MINKLQRVVVGMLYLNGLHETFQTSGDFHIQLKNDPWLPLVIERHSDDISVTHYVVQGGDSLRDPEMVFSLQAWADASRCRFAGWVPKSIEPGGFGRVYPTGSMCEDGRTLRYSPRRMREAYSFAAMWARNLREQGFVKRYPASDISSLTHPADLQRVLGMPTVPIHIRHAVSPCADGSEIHHYLFPADLPRSLRTAAYRRAEEALKLDWPNWAEFGFGITGEGLVLHTRVLPPCTCGGGP
jgi:hypothetical protein